MKIGELIAQPEGYRAFIPASFPPKELGIPPAVQVLDAEATLALGKLDGMAQLLPDIDFFIYMYVRKEATLSSNIEGTKATMHDALRADINSFEGMPRDVENILAYIQALNYGLSRLKDLPLSLRLMREIHQQLMGQTQEGIGKTPGRFRTSQNWIGGTKPANAEYVPPPPPIMKGNLDDLERFLHAKSHYSPLVRTGLAHAQFETIHPFLDGNGRTGRLLVTLYLCQQGVIEQPILYLSEFLKRHRDTYFKRLAGYHDEGRVDEWLLFFLEGVKTVAEEATAVTRRITALRERDMLKVRSLGGKQALSADKLLLGLFRQPLVEVATAETITGLTRPAANQLISKFVKLGILTQTNERATYRRQFAYSEYLDLFS